MDKVDVAIMRLKEANQMSQQIYGKPLVVTTSGGKDSSVCVSLAEKAGIPFEILHNHTTADAPETVLFVKEEFKRLEGKGIKCTINYPVYKGKRTSMWDLIQTKLIPPTRWRRYCCDILKEHGFSGIFAVTGVRWDESKKRENGRGIYEKNNILPEKRIILTSDNDEKRRLIESCKIKSRMTCNPIVDWLDKDVWDYIKSENCTINPLYECGFERVGCIGCPLARKEKRNFEFLQYPRYKNLYLKSFEKMIDNRLNRGIKTDRLSAEEEFHYWMEDGVLPGQMNLFDMEVEE